jgi:hypothetical protein
MPADVSIYKEVFEPVNMGPCDLEPCDLEPFDLEAFDDMTLSDHNDSEEENKVVAHAEKLCLHGPPSTTPSPTKGGYTAWVVFNGRTNGVFETWYVYITVITSESCMEGKVIKYVSGQRLGRKLAASQTVIRGVSGHETTLKLHGIMPLPMELSVVLAPPYL